MPIAIVLNSDQQLARFNFITTNNSFVFILRALSQSNFQQQFTILKSNTSCRLCDSVSKCTCWIENHFSGLYFWFEGPRIPLTTKLLVNILFCAPKFPLWWDIPEGICFLWTRERWKPTMCLKRSHFYKYTNRAYWRHVVHQVPRENHHTPRRVQRIYSQWLRLQSLPTRRGWAELGAARRAWGAAIRTHSRPCS